MWEDCICFLSFPFLYFQTHTPCLSTQNKYWPWSPSYLHHSTFLSENIQSQRDRLKNRNCSTLDCSLGQKWCVTILNPKKWHCFNFLHLKAYIDVILPYLDFFFKRYGSIFLELHVKINTYYYYCSQYQPILPLTALLSSVYVNGLVWMAGKG